MTVKIPQTIEGKQEMLRRVADEMDQAADGCEHERLAEWAIFDPDSPEGEDSLLYALGSATNPETDRVLATLPPTDEASRTLHHLGAWEPLVARSVAALLREVAERIGGKAWSGSRPALEIARRWDESNAR